MNTKDRIALMLEEAGDELISGSALSEEMGLTRAAVWKCIKALCAEGYDIKSCRRGYRLGPDNDALSENLIKRYLGDLSDIYELEVFSEIDSTNDHLKRTIPKTWHAAISSCQTAGRGRRGRSFISPAKTGLYLSVMLRPQSTAEIATKITTAAAVAACCAIEECTDEKPLIKWVNDVFVRQKKVCGILTEASLDLESGMPEWVIMGIGFNVYEPEGGFPDDIKHIAGSITSERTRDLRSRLAAAFLRRFYDICSDIENTDHSEEYKKRSFLIGRDVDVISGEKNKAAHVLDIDENCRLIVRYKDGSEEALSSGEVSVRPKSAGGQ